MVKLADKDIETREVLGWKGLHVFHHPFSSCSQKLRIFLNLKCLRWEPHVVDLGRKENFTAWFLGINPRGLLPVLVHDGQVHIESNDILLYLEERYGEPRLIPTGSEQKLAALLKHENDLHLDLRALTFRFVFAPSRPPKSAEDLRRYAVAGSGTVLGQKDDRIDIEIGFWRSMAFEGITDAVAWSAAAKFRAAFGDLDERLATHQYLLGDGLSVLDIAWFVNANRLVLAGYPLFRLHPRLGRWFDKLKDRPAFAREIALPPPLRKRFDAIRARHLIEGKSLEQVAGL